MLDAVQSMRERMGALVELHLENLPHSVELARGESGVVLRYIDERLLPGEFKIAETQDWREVVDAIKTLAVRGAPAIGVAGAAALALWAAHGEEESDDDLDAVADTIANARPTAVNLSWGVRHAVECAKSRDASDSAESAADALYELVKRMESEDEATNRAIGANGAALLVENAGVLTHCNAGSLATVFYGTALGVVYAAAEQGKIAHVYADETRPVNQGSRLTAWELSHVGVPTTLICDDMAASLMAQGCVDAVIVGADRIARNGDTANKIGTYGVALLAHAHGIPFYVAAPFSTIDATIADGSQIVIEQRDRSEVLPEGLEGVDVWNPAFDVTPARLIDKIITERGVFTPAELKLQL